MSAAIQPSKFRGTGVALVTPFLPGGAIDYPSLAKLIDYVIDGGVDYIVSLGTTGEAITLTTQECRDVLTFTIENVNGRVPIVAGYFGSNFTERLRNFIRDFDFTGVDAIMSSSPAYSKPPQEGIYRHYMSIAEVSPVPIIIYNVPGRTGSNVTAKTTLRLAEAGDKFVAVKEASGDLCQAMDILKYRPDHFLVLSGDDQLTLPLIAAGGHGAISVIANVLPAHFSGMVRAALQHDFTTAQDLNFQLLDVHPWLYCEGNPVGIKAAMAIKGLCRNELRIPLVPLSETNYQQLQRQLKDVPEMEQSASRESRVAR